MCNTTAKRVDWLRFLRQFSHSSNSNKSKQFRQTLPQYTRRLRCACSLFFEWLHFFSECRFSSSNPFIWISLEFSFDLCFLFKITILLSALFLLALSTLFAITKIYWLENWVNSIHAEYLFPCRNAEKKNIKKDLV